MKTRNVVALMLLQTVRIMDVAQMPYHKYVYHTTKKIILLLRDVICKAIFYSINWLI